MDKVVPSAGQPPSASSLLYPGAMPVFDAVRVPKDLYFIKMEPTPLAGMPCPRPAFPWDSLSLLGFQHVVCLAGDDPGYDPAPLKVIAAGRCFDPAKSKAQPRKVRKLVSLVIDRLSSGEGVIVQCGDGRGWSGTILGCVLRQLGYDTDTVVSYLDEIQRARGEDGWPESQWQEEAVRRFSNALTRVGKVRRAEQLFKRVSFEGASRISVLEAVELFSFPIEIHLGQDQEETLFVPSVDSCWSTWRIHEEAALGSVDWRTLSSTQRRSSALHRAWVALSRSPGTRSEQYPSILTPDAHLLQYVRRACVVCRRGTSLPSRANGSLGRQRQRSNRAPP